MGLYCVRRGEVMVGFAKFDKHGSLHGVLNMRYQTGRVVFAIRLAGLGFCFFLITIYREFGKMD